MNWQRYGEAVEAARAVVRPRSSCSCVGMCSQASWRGRCSTTGCLAGWSIVVTSVPRRLLSWGEPVVAGTVRWQIELPFRLWKQDGHIDEGRSTKCWRILCELYAKRGAMLLQPRLIEVGCWRD